MQKHRREKKTVKVLSKKTLLAAFAGLCVLAAGLVASCSNIGADYDGPANGAQNAGVQTAEGVLTAKVAMPNMPSIKRQKSGSPKSAFPGLLQAAGSAFSFEATLSSAAATYSTSGTFDDTTSTCDFAFAGALSDAAQTYTLSVQLYHKSGLGAEKKLVASGSQTVTVDGGDTSFAANVSLLPNTDAAAPKGSVGLSIKFSDATSVTNLTVQFKDSAGTDWADDYLDGGSTVNLTGGEGTISSAADKIPAGSYTLLMTFNKVTAEGTMVVGSRTESVNVYPAMETNSWWTNGAPTDTLDISKNEQTEFWVKGTGGKFYTELYTAAPEAKDTNIGSFAAPLATIQAAVDRINTIGNTTTQYTIYIDGKVTGAADANYGSAKNFALVNVTGEREILFKGWTGPDKDIIDVNKYDGSSKPLYPGHAFAIATESKITLQNLCLTKASGDATDGSSNGGAIFVGASSADADVTIINSKISGNLAVNGGGIAISKGKVLLKQCVVTDNEASSNGGGIYANGSTVDKPSFTIEDSEISFNKATGTGSSSGGGGLYVGNYAKTYFKSGLVGSDDSANGNTGKYGGGVYVNSNGKFYMSGSSRVGGNTASSNGGGIYNGGTVYMSGSAIVGADPSSLTDTAKKEAAQEADGKHSNMAYAGGGIYTSSPAGIKLGWVDESNPDTAFAGGIYYNCAKSSSGGGVYSNSVSGKTFDLERGSVCYNGAKGYGGGICVYFSGTTGSQITMTGGEVSNNSAKDGGGVYAFDASISGGTIAGNTASNCGGGVYASQEFYLYGTGVIGDDGTHEVAEADDCSNKAKAGGGVYGHKVYIGYSAASTPAACTGGIYRNYATAVKGSETYFYGGGGICVRGTSAYWLFKMQSGTVAYNAGDSSDGYGGGLFIYGSGAPDSSIAYPEAIGGSFEGNGAKYGGAVCCYSRTLGLGGSIYMPSATGENGDNDIYLQDAFLHLLSNFDSATPTPVVTITPPAYSIGQKIFEEDDTLLPTNCEKVAIASDGSGAPWAVSNKGLLVKDCAECYVSQTTGGDDTSHDGSFSKPYKSIYYAAKQFSNKTAPLGGTEYKPTFKNIIYVLSDMTFTLGAGADSGEACNYEVVGRAGDVAGSPVTFTFNTDSGSGFYVPATHIVMLKNINITQNQTTCPTIAYAAIQADGGTLYMEDCSITGIKANNCSAIAADGDGGAGSVYLKNVSIKDNVTVPNVSGGSVWGPAVSVKTGTLHVLGKVEICDNTMEGYGNQNVWIGENSGTPVFHPIVVAGKLSTGTSIGVTTYDISATEFTTGYKAAGNTAEPRTYFASDNEMQVVWNTAVDEAELKLPTTIYVSSTSASPAGSDTAGDGSETKPYATVQKALNVLDGYNVAGNNYTIKVNGQVVGASTIKSGINATKITVQGKTGASSDKLKGSSSAAVLTISDTIPVDISDLTITGGQRGVNMAAAATVTITDCEITENTGSVSGTGVYVYAGGSITIKDTNITKNTANGSSSSGGGIYVATSTGLTHFEVSGGSISNNTAKEGGAATLHCQNGITPILSGVTISANKATSGNAGGIYVPNGRYLNITDCEISGNTATGGNGGGGLYVVGTCNVYGSTTISGNTATSGAGGGIYNSGTCNIYGSTAISANNASSGNGGGVFNSGTCKIYGSTTISGNTATGGNGGGIYTTGTCYIYGSTKIGDSSASGTAAAESATGKHSNMATATTGSTPTGGQGGGIYNGGNLYIGYSAWSGTSGTASALTSGGGVYYNYAASTGGGIYNAASKTLVIGSGTYKLNASASGGGGVFTAGAFTMNNGTIDSNSAVLGGGGVYSAKGGSFTMANGTISSNKVTGTPGSGGGVCAIGTFSMTTGTIKNNSAKYGGGLYVANTATMQNGYITGNSASVNGAGVHIEVSDSTLTPKFTLSGGEISSNAVSSTASGGGISNKDGTLIISGGTITSNDGGQLGGGILSMSTSSMSAGTISGNSSSVGGGGIYTNSGTFTMTGGTISGNSSVAGGGVCVGENSTFSFTAGTISTNTVTTSSGKGGAAFIQGKSSTSSTDGVFKIGSSATIPAGDSSGATGAGKNDVYTEAKLTISSAVSGTTPVATITPPTYDTGLQVLTGTSALLSGYHGKFAVTPNSVGAWSIDEYGYLRQEASGSGSVTIYTPDGQLVLTADKTAIAASGATTVTLTAKNASGTNITSSSDITAWKIEVYYGASLTLVNSATTNKYTFAATYPAGTYRMVVSVTYKGVTYTDTIVLAK